MKKQIKDKLIVVAAMCVVYLFAGCAIYRDHCTTDACYDRQIATQDPFSDGEVAAWGETELQQNPDKRLEMNHMKGER